MSIRRNIIHIKTDWCKSCGICAAFCPTGALSVVPGEKARATDEESCTGCGLCERLCPDLAIEIRRVEVSV
ncbi:MAG: 4Fe-4S binding protein [Spirochaetaceae bacterium]|nr:4Fe-4S binding protein [Spirochaetaceae bacterium]